MAAPADTSPPPSRGQTVYLRPQLTDPPLTSDDLPTQLHDCSEDVGKAWLVGDNWYIWMGDHYRVFYRGMQVVIP